MFQPGSITRPRLFALAAGLALTWLGLAGVRGQPPLQQSLVDSANAQPISLFADDIATWLEGGQRAFLLKGKVVVTQGVTTIRLPQGVVWVDEAKKEKTGAYHLDLYGDGNVTLENGPKAQAGVGGFLQLATRGEVRIKTYKSKVAESNLANDPIYQRAAQARAGGQAALAEPKTPGMLPPLAATPLLPDRIPTSPPGPNGTNDSGIKQVQAVVPVPPSGPTVSPIPGVPGPPAPPPVLPPPRVDVPPPPRPPGDGRGQNLSVRPRSSQEIQFQNTPLPNGETAWVVTNGVILTVSDPDSKKGVLDIEADRLVFWTKGGSQDLLNNLRGPSGQTTQALEFYLSGNVEIRFQTKKETEILRADEVYYDVGRKVAIALRADLEVRDPKLIYPIHVRADEVYQLNAKLFQANNAVVYSSQLPSDPGLTVEVRQVTIEEREIERKRLFGTPFIDRATGAPPSETQRYFTGNNFLARIEGVPVFWFPYLRGNVEDPLGPLEAISFNGSRPFGFQVMTTWDMFDLLGIDKIPGQRWRLYADYLTRRGPALGTEYDFAGKNLFGIDNRYQGLLKAYGIHDDGEDILGGDRGTTAWVTPFKTVPVDHPDWRGRVLGRVNVLDLPAGFTVQGQVSALSDQNFLEQYYHQEFLNDLNQETFLFVRQQNNQWQWNLLAEPRIRHWVTETEWLPKAEGALIGQSIFDMFTWNVHGSAGYAQLRPTEDPSFAYSPTDARINTGRFDLWSDLSMPFTLGAFRVVPYVVGDAAHYTTDLTGSDATRLYGAAGLRASIPFTKPYPAVESELFNLHGLVHKIVLSTNYYFAESDTPFWQLPQLDRFNDDTSDQALRDIRPRQIFLNPGNAFFLTTSPLFDPQVYALRRLIDNRADTLDDMEVVQLGLRQRWQTKRGFPGNEHVVDWMTLDLHASVFPHSRRDNFGEHLGILEYDWIWNVGDRTALISNGWFETIDNGPRVFNIGAVLNRTDRTNFYLGYRQIDPLESKAVVGSVAYALSAKYAITASTVYDFGVHNEHFTVGLTRIGTDLQLTLGVSWNSVLDSFGVQFEIVPNLLANRPGNPLFGAPMVAAGR